MVLEKYCGRVSTPSQYLAADELRAKKLSTAVCHMHLVVFDVDGTLINADRSHVGDDCFWRAVREIFELSPDDSCWVDGLRHVTARCIAAQLCEQRCSRIAMESELEALVVRYDALLAIALSREVEEGYATRGARELLSWLNASSEYACAIATGCFRQTAQRKLHKAGVVLSGMPLAASDTYISREDIMRSSLEQAERRYACSYSCITYVGDGLWDLAAASNLGWNFVGISSGKQAEEMRRAGAEHVLPHFSPIEEFRNRLKRIAFVR